MNNIKIVDDFVWLIVTDNAHKIYKNCVFELYALYDDGSESLIQSEADIKNAIDNDLQIGIDADTLIKILPFMI